MLGAKPTATTTFDYIELPERKAETVAAAKNEDDGDGIFLSNNDDMLGTGIEVGATGSLSSSLQQQQKPLSPWLAAWYSFWYPPGTPRECQLFRSENIAIPASYFMVGLLQGLSGPLINVLPLDLGATESQQVTVAILDSLPASFKVLFGFLSDNVPLAGYRRKSYMLIGWITCSLAMCNLVASSNLRGIRPTNASCFGWSSSGDNDEENDNEFTVVPEDAPSIPLLAATFLTFGGGMWLADVMADALVAEKARLEPPELRGSIQSTCYSYRFFGVMCAVNLSTYLYTRYGPLPVVALLGILPLLTVPAIYALGEISHLPIRSTREQCLEIWNTVCSRATFQPMGFVFLYNIMQVGNAAWKEFGRTVLQFTSCQLNLLFIVALVLLYLGILAYKMFFLHSSWRNVYIATTILGALFSILQVLLIYDKTFGLPPFWFALGDDAFAEFVQGIQFLPTTIMMVSLCPEGSEGSSYAMFTTINNAALNLSSILSTSLLGVWDVSKEAMSNGDLSGMAKLTYLTTALQLSAICFVGWLPHSKDDLMKLNKSRQGRSIAGGMFLLGITCLSICYAILVGTLNILSPGWMGES